jgi:hypothetical protein
MGLQKVKLKKKNSANEQGKLTKYCDPDHVMR